MEEPGRLQTMGSQRVGHDRATLTLTFSVLEFWDDELTRPWDQGAVKSLLQ